MRIISGRFGGRRLTSFSADHIRPTTDRIKGSIFNKLAAQVPGARVLDLFSGTGNLGIEALSREAAEVCFVESHPKSVAIIRQNLEMLKVKEGFKLINQDVFKFLGNYVGNPFNLILIDPPFTEKLADKVMLALATSAVIGPGSVIAIEAAAREKLEPGYPPLVEFDRREYGDKTVGFFTCPPP